MKQRMIAIFCIVIISLYSVFGNVQSVYANVALTANQVDVLYGLLSSMGVFASTGGTDTDKRHAIGDLWDSMSAEEAAEVLEGLGGGTVVTDSYNKIHYKFGDNVNYDWFSDFYNSVHSIVFSGDGSFVMPSASASTSYPNTDGVFQTLGYATDVPIVCWYLGTGRVVTGFLSDGTFLNYSVSSNGTVTARSHHMEHFSTGSYITFKASTSTMYLFNYSFNVYSSDGTLLDYLSGGHCQSAYGAIIGTSSGYSCYGYYDVSDLSLGLDISADSDSVIPADTWSRGWSTSLENNQDVSVVLPGEGNLTGYDDLTNVYDTEHGLITGVDIPGYVDSQYGYGKTTDTDLTADLEGVTTGIEGANTRLDKLYNLLKALPATLGTLLSTKIIGSGSLDLSGFKNIDLSGVFPFCIPFDLIHSFQGFNVTATEPKWKVDLSGTALEAGGSVDIDLTQFSDIFSIVRYFVYGSFVVGLILATRKLVKG